MDKQQQRLVGALALSGNALTTLLLPVLVRRHVIPHEVAIEVVDGAMLQMEIERAKMPPALHAVCDMSRDLLARVIPLLASARPTKPGGQ